MHIIFENRFIKALKKLTPENRKRVNIALELFKDNPLDPKLRNHPLKGDLRGLRSFSAAYDLRIIYKEEGGHLTVIMINVGTHDEVY